MKTSIFDFAYRLPRGKYFLLGGFSFVVILSGWQLAVSAGLVEAFFLPPPIEVIRATFGLFSEGGFLEDCKASFFRVSVGYLLAAILAIPVGVLIGAFHLFEALLEPPNDFIRYTPLPAFIPLIILWFGIGDVNQIVIIFLGVFWSLIVMVADSTGNVPVSLIETAETLGTSRTRILLRVIVPYASPGIFDSLRVAIGWAWSSLILAEIVGANTGIGHMIMESQRFLRTANVIAGIIMVGLFGIILDYIFKAVYRPLFPWAEKSN